VSTKKIHKSRHLKKATPSSISYQLVSESASKADQTPRGRIFVFDSVTKNNVRVGEKWEKSRKKGKMGKMKWGILFFGYMLLCSYDDVMALIVLKCFYVFKDSECVNSIINVFFTKAATTATCKAGADMQIGKNSMTLLMVERG